MRGDPVTLTSKNGTLAGQFFPLLFALLQCQRCGEQYSARSGKSGKYYARRVTWSLLGVLGFVLAYGVLYYMLMP